MVQYTKDGREVFLTSENPDLPGVYMVKNLDGTTEPYTGKIEDLCVGVEIKSPVVFGDTVIYASGGNVAVIEKLKELAGKQCLADSELGPDDVAGDDVKEAYLIGLETGEVCLARGILGMLGLR